MDEYLCNGYASGHISYLGGMQSDPIFNQKGLLLVFGGDQSKSSIRVNDAEPVQPFFSVSVYDPESRNWYTQETTGHNGEEDIPPATHMFCHVGAQAWQGTFEM